VAAGSSAELTNQRDRDVLLARHRMRSGAASGLKQIQLHSDGLLDFLHVPILPPLRPVDEP
jgi:hypothetical protein